MNRGASWDTIRSSSAFIYAICLCNLSQKSKEAKKNYIDNEDAGYEGDMARIR